MKTTLIRLVMTGALIHLLSMTSCSSRGSRSHGGAAHDASVAPVPVQDAGPRSVRDPDDDRRRQELLEHVRSGGPAGHAALIAGMDDPSPFVRGTVPYLVMATHPADAFEILRRLSTDQSTTVRVLTAEALDYLGTPEALTFMLEWGTADPDKQVRFTTAEMFAGRGDRRIIPFLKREVLRSYGDDETKLRIMLEDFHESWPTRP